MLLAIAYSIASKTNTCNKTVSFITHVQANQSIPEFSKSLKETHQGCNFFLSDFNQSSIPISDNCSVIQQPHMTGKVFDLNSEGFFDNDYFLFSFNCSSLQQRQRSSDSNQSKKFKDPFEDDEIQIPIYYGCFLLFEFLLHLAFFAVSFNIGNNRFYQVLGIIYTFLLCLLDIMSFMWLFVHESKPMSFEYHMSVIVIWSVSNVFLFIWSYSALHGIGFYAERLKALDIIALILLIIVSVGSNIFLSLAYYMFDEKTYKIIISALFPSKFIIEMISVLIIPKEFRALKEKSLEGLEEESEEYKKTKGLFDTELYMGTFTAFFLVRGALNPVMRYIMHFEDFGCFVLVFHILFFGLIYYLIPKYSPQCQPITFQALETAWAQQDEPPYLV